MKTVAPSLKEVFVADPPSREIAARLNAGGAEVCEHKRNPCYLRCGVRNMGKEWVVLTKKERIDWLLEITKK